MDKFFDSLYTRLILRDAVGKVAPGSLLLVALYMSILSPAPDIHSAIAAARQTPPPQWILLIGLGWITAFAIQAFGGWLPKCRFLPYVRHSGEPFEDLVEFHKNLTHFVDKATESQKQLFERFVVIKEATGNASLSLLLSGVLLAVSFCERKAMLLSGAMILGAVCLAMMHREAIKLQTVVFEEVLAKHKSEGAG